MRDLSTEAPDIRSADSSPGSTYDRPPTSDMSIEFGPLAGEKPGVIARLLRASYADLLRLDAR